MKKSDLFAFVKSDSIKSLVSATEIKTQEDIDRLQEQGYLIGFTEDELTEVFSDRIAQRLCFNNGFDKTFYYDKEKNVLFHVPLYGRNSLTPYTELKVEIMQRAITIEKEIETGNYYSSLILLNDRMRMEMLNILIEQDKLKEPYALFADFYQTSDYGCSELSVNSVKKLQSFKTEKQRAETQERLKDFPDTVTVYRGEGDKSANWKSSITWTTDINVANFFASRMEGREARIHIAEVDKKDIIEFFNTESECIVLPENIRVKDQIPIKGLDFLEEQLPQVSDKYIEFRDIVLDELEFNIDDEEHGRLHTLRVLINVLLLANQNGLSEQDINKLCTAAIFHDTKRTNNGDDENHGRDSADYYREFVSNFFDVGEYSKTVDNLIIYHCIPDEVGKSSMPESDWQLYDILKDADALDRVRFGIRDLDLNQLRTDEAKSLTMVSNLILQGIRIPEPTFEQGMDLM